MRRTKIVCTLGPAVDGPGQLSFLATSGMDVARLNFSHGTHAEHKVRLEGVRQAAQESGKSLAVLQDLCGPKIRVGNVAVGTRLQKDSRFVLTADDVPGNEEVVHLPVPAMFAAVRPGNHLLLDDGLLELVVTEKTQTELVTRVITGGTLGSKKGISAPGVTLDVDAVTEKDIEDVRFGLSIGVDYVALSFVREAADVIRLRQIMKEAHRTVPIIVKIEKAEAIANLEEILHVADGAMVARGDLGVEMPVEEIAMAQKKIIRACNRLGKPVITATQMLDSMIRNPRPTRAEVTDIANAVLDGTDAVMLSGETAAGAYPFESVQMMARIAECAERDMDFAKILSDKQPHHGWESLTDAIGEAVVQIAQDQKAAAIVCSTSTGGTARAVAKFKPSMPILAATTRPETCRQMALYWGCRPMLVPMPHDTDEMIQHAVEAAVEHHYVREGDLVVITAGTPIGVPGSTNLIKVHYIGQPLTQPARRPDH
ncbi:MAG: pyruvate kinase [Capsulimonadales bacterium]|nr:pyruvate kinase [Capsulimonadales bacterium]